MRTNHPLGREAFFLHEVKHSDGKQRFLLSPGNGQFHQEFAKSGHCFVEGVLAQVYIMWKGNFLDRGDGHLGAEDAMVVSESRH